MPSGTVVAEIAATVEQVWDVITDLENAPQWVPDLLSVRRIDSGPLGVGSKFEQIMNVQGRKVEMIVTIEELDAPQVISHSGKGGSVKIGGRATLSETPDGCNVINEWTLELSGLLKLASPIAGNWTQNNIEESMRRLRTRFEHQA